MGYTHFSKVVGVNGVFTGEKGSEVQITPTTNVSLYPVTTGAATAFTVAPVSGTISGYTCYSVAGGTGRAVTVTAGSAGAILLDTSAVAAQGTTGTPVVMSNSSGTTTVTAGNSLGIHLATCATAQVAVNVVLVFTPTTV